MYNLGAWASGGGGCKVKHLPLPGFWEYVTVFRPITFLKTKWLRNYKK